MQAAKRALLRTERVVDLTEMIDKIVLAELLLAKYARAKTPLIPLPSELEQVWARGWYWGEDHECNTRDVASIYATSLRRWNRRFKARNRTNWSLSQSLLAKRWSINLRCSSSIPEAKL